MPVYPGSRYQGVGRSAIERTAGVLDTILHTRERLKAEDLGEGYVVHTVETGDELDLLAWYYGGKARLGWLIADVNELVFPFDLEVGQELIIPPPEEFSKR